QCRALADRRTGVGCDQILTIEPPAIAGAVAGYRIWNADGSASGQCGNGARCVAAWLARDGTGRGPRFVLERPAGVHAVDVLSGDRYRVAMGRPRFAPAQVPMAGIEREEVRYEVVLPGIGTLGLGAVSMGNPHAVPEVEDVVRAEVG